MTNSKKKFSFPVQNPLIIFTTKPAIEQLLIRFIREKIKIPGRCLKIKNAARVAEKWIKSSPLLIFKDLLEECGDGDDLYRHHQGLN